MTPQIDLTTIDTTAIRTRLSAAHNEIAALNAGAHSWTTRFPADPHGDSDLVIGAALADTMELLTTVEDLVIERASTPRVGDLISAAGQFLFVVRTAGAFAEELSVVDDSGQIHDAPDTDDVVVVCRPAGDVR